MKIYLHQFLSKSGLFSSKKAVLDAIKNEEINIDEQAITKANFHFNTEKHKVYWKDKLVEPLEPLYIIINKPEGYISSRITSDDTKLKKKSVFELLKEQLSDAQKKSLFCVGRLDEDTSGLLIITNDGQLGTKVTNPRHHIRKTYAVTLRDALSDRGKKRVEEGIRITLEENGKKSIYQTQPCKIIKKSPTQIEIIITEGKKRQVRRMFEAIGNKVEALERISIGSLALTVEKGTYIFVKREFLVGKLGLR